MSSPERLSIQLAQLESAQLVRRLAEEDLAYQFKHALTQESAYGSLLVKKRREIHRRVAEAFEGIYADQLAEYASVLADHYAKAGDDAKTATYATRAGERAANISAYVEAGVQFAAALEALSRLPDTEQNRKERIAATIKRINVSWGIDTAEENLKRLFGAEALARTLPESDRSALARIHYWIGRVYSYRNDNRQAGRYYEQMLKTARDSGDEELFGLGSSGGGRTFFIQGYFGRAVPLLQQAIPYLERTGNWQEWILAKVSLAISLAAQGYYRKGRSQGEEAVEKALALNDLSSTASARGMTARVEFMAGDLERMLEETRETEKQVEGVNPLVHYMILGFRAWAQSRLGNEIVARATMAAADRVAAPLGKHLIFADWFAAARAEIELNAGDSAQAIRLALEAIKEAQSAGGIFAEAIAQRVWGQALANADAQGDMEALSHLDESLKLFLEGDARVEAARTQLVLGRLLMARGDLAAARADLEQAATQFTLSGITLELEEAHRLIDSLEKA